VKFSLIFEIFMRNNSQLLGHVSCSIFSPDALFPFAKTTAYGFVQFPLNYAMIEIHG